MYAYTVVKVRCSFFSSLCIFKERNDPVEETQLFSDFDGAKKKLEELRENLDSAFYEYRIRKYTMASESGYVVPISYENMTA